MADSSHRHRSTSDWVRLFENADDEASVLASCQAARDAWTEGLPAWADHVLGCSTCCEIARAQELFGDTDALDCPECRSNLEVLHQLLAETEHYEPVTLWELQRAEQTAEELPALSLAEQMRRAVSDPCYQQWGFVQRLLLEARAHWHRDPHHALERSLLAVVAAQALDPDSYGKEWIADLEAKAHAYVGNAHRLLGEFRDAETEFDLAEECLRHGVGSGAAAARVFSLKASLLKDQLHHHEALALLENVERFYEQAGERHEMGRMALLRSIVLEIIGQPLNAADECVRAEELLDAARDPQLPLLARRNAVDFLITAGKIRRARFLFERLPTMPEPLEKIRHRWVEAHLLRAEERYGEARATYEEVRRAFADADLHYNAALATLDLALTAYQEGGHLHEVRDLAQEATVQLTLSGAKPQAFAAQRLLLRAVQDDAVNLAVLEQVRHRLRGLRPA